MFLASKLGLTLGAVALSLLALPAAQAQTTPAFYSDTFQQDDNNTRYPFVVTTFGTVNLYTTSYGGGLNVDGSTTAAGGFDPIISLFTADGTYIDAVDDSPVGNPDPIGPLHEIFDAGLQADLAPGSYLAVITEFNNYPLQALNDNPNVTYSLSDGFTQDGQGNFTSDVGFTDVDGNLRTSSFNLNIDNGAFQPVPEGSTTVSFGLLLTLGLGGAVVAARKKARASAA